MIPRFNRLILLSFLVFLLILICPGTHLSTCSKIVSKFNGIIRKLRQYLPLHSLKTRYISHILPYLSYGVMIWADSNNSNLDSMFLLQKRVIRSCTKSHWLAHTDPFFSSFSTQDIYKLQLASFMYQFHHQLLPPDLHGDDFFNADTPSHSFDTRHAHEPFITTTNSVLVSNTPKSQGPQVWFQLPIHLKDSPAIASFKNAFKKFSSAHMTVLMILNATHVS